MSGCGFGMACQLPLQRAAPAQLVQQQVNNRRGKQRDHLAHDQAADDGDAQRPAQLRALAEADGQRQRAEAGASVVIKIGLKRSRQASRTAAYGERPRERSASSAKSMMRMAFFFTMPINKNRPISAMIDSSILKMSSASTAPTPAEGSVDSTVIGMHQLSYSTPSRM